MNKKCIILDRDGVINHDRDDYIKSLDEFVLVEGAIEAIARLNKAGYLVAVATNQAGPARGIFPRELVGECFETLHRQLASVGGHLDYVAMCLHHPAANCDCRKPKPGLLHEIQDQLGIDLTQAVFVGDSYKDIQAAEAVGATPVLVKTGKGERTLSSHPQLESEVKIFDNLTTFVDSIIS